MDPDGRTQGDFRSRTSANRLGARLRALPVVVLTGARQTGKTALAQAFPGRRTFLSLNDLDILGQARTDPESLVASRPVTLDEVQRAPELLLPVKRQVDRQRMGGCRDAPSPKKNHLARRDLPRLCALWLKSHCSSGGSLPQHDPKGCQSRSKMQREATL